MTGNGVAVVDIDNDGRPDVIFAESTSMAPYALAHPEVPLVMDYVDGPDTAALLWVLWPESQALPTVRLE